MKHLRTTGRVAAAALVVATLVPAFAVGSQASWIDLAPAAQADPDGKEARDAGVWQVESLGSDQYAVSWRGPNRLPVTSDRPRVVGPGRPVGCGVDRRR